MNLLYPFIITALAGLSTVIGYFVIYLKYDKNKILVSSLSFASGVMVCVSITDLIPSSFNYLSNIYFYIFAILLIITSIVVGINISLLIDKYLSKLNEKDNIHKLGLMSLFAIVLHNIPEGIITYMTSTNNLRLGLTLSFAIALHNIPEGISISYPIYYSSNNKRKAFLYTFIAGISELLGAIITYIFLNRFINDIFMGILLGIIAGIMIHISIFEFLKTSYQYNNKKNILIFFILGFLMMIISHLI